MKLADVSIRNPVLAIVMVAAPVVFGIVGFSRIGVDMLPDIEFPVVTVTAIYPGADPETIETKVCEKLEEAIGTVAGIKTLRSSSTDSVGLVVVEFDLERNVDQATQDVRDKVARALRDLPKDMEPPLIERLDPNAAPVLSIAVTGSRSIRELTHIADKQIKEKLQTLTGVGSIDLVGGQDREFHVFVDPNRLAAMSLSVMDVAHALAAQNVDIPGGRLEEGVRELAVKTRGQVRSASEIGNIIITASGGAPVHVSDVARVEDGLKEKRSHSSLNGKSAVALVVRKQSRVNTVEVVRTVRRAIEDLQQRLPAGVTLSVPTDNSVTIQSFIQAAQDDVFLGAALAVVIILLFLHDWRATLISALAIPTSIVATFAFMKVMGFTFNLLTMMALSLSIGILVDDAIVVIENIHRHLETGKPAMRAASDATSEIGLAVLATTASIVAVFVPVASMKGFVGRVFMQFGLTVAFAVSASLFVAFTLTPMLAARLFKAGSHKSNIISRGIERSLKRLDGGYRALLATALRHRAWTLLIATAAFLASFVVVRVVKREFVSEPDRGNFNVKLETPVGTTLAATRERAEGVAARIRKLPGVADTFLTVGGGAQSEVNLGEIRVNLVPRESRAFTQWDAIRHVRAQLVSEKGVKVAVEPLSIVGGDSASKRQAAVQFDIRGKDYRELNKAANQIMQAMRQKGGYVDLDTTYRGGKPEIGINIDRGRAADLGVPIASLAMAVRMLVGGEKTTDVQIEGDRLDVRVRLDEAFRSRPQDILALKVRSTNPGSMGSPPPLVDLSNLVSVDRGTGPGKIERQNRQRQVTVLANLEGKTLGEAMPEIEREARKLSVHLDTGWAGSGQRMTESFQDLVGALVLAIVIVYLILAAQFGSFLHPFTIMLSLPLAVVGAFGALALAGQTLSLMSMIGIIMLMGLVTKNAILLVDYTNVLRGRGLSCAEALLAAGPVRLRPILMTTAAMIFGMLPVALGLSEGSDMRSSMAVVVIGGLITSTLLTLVVVPVAYSLLDNVAARFKRKESASGAAIKAVSVVIALLFPSIAHGAPTRLGLGEAVELALGRNLQIRQARVRVSEADAGRRSVRGSFGPSLSLDTNLFVWNDEVNFHLGSPSQEVLAKHGAVLGKYSDLMTALPDLFGLGAIRERVTSQTLVTLTQPLTPLYSVAKSYQIANAATAVARHELTSAQESVIYEVTRTYIGLKQATSAVEIAGTARDQVAAHLVRAKIFHQAGVVGQSDVLKAEVALAEAKQRVIQAQTTEALARSALAVLLALPPTEIIVPTENFRDPAPKLNHDLDALVNLAVERRAELRSSEQRIAIAKRGRDVARWDLVPQVVVMATYEHNEGLGTLQPSDAVFAGGALKWKVWDWGATYYKSKQAAYKVQQAELGEKQLRDGIYLEVQRSFLDLRAADQTLEVTRKAVAQAEESFRIEQAKFEKNANTTTDVLDAQLALTRAMVSHTSALYQRYASQAALVRATGSSAMMVRQ